MHINYFLMFFVVFETPSTKVTATKEELIRYFKEMYTMRRMEITNDTEYKARNIRGFCHLYDGQEAIASGTHAALTMEDAWITSYRCHCTALLRGSTVEQVFAELFGYSNGTSKGKGGSMHFYSKKANFFGGQGESTGYILLRVSDPVCRYCGCSGSRRSWSGLRRQVQHS